jgi:hypothetical protein
MSSKIRLAKRKREDQDTKVCKRPKSQTLPFQPPAFDSTTLEERLCEGIAAELPIVDLIRMVRSYLTPCGMFFQSFQCFLHGVCNLCQEAVCVKQVKQCEHLLDDRSRCDEQIHKNCKSRACKCCERCEIHSTPQVEPCFSCQKGCGHCVQYCSECKKSHCNACGKQCAKAQCDLCGEGSLAAPIGVRPCHRCLTCDVCPACLVTCKSDDCFSVGCDSCIETCDSCEKEHCADCEC